MRDEKDSPAAARDLDALFDEGRAAWPDVKLDRADFVAFVSKRTSPEEGERSETSATLRGAELYLVCACAKGDARAMEALDARYLCEIPSFLARSGATARFVEDVRQHVRERLFVEGKVASYTGRGALSSWLRVVTLRVASNLRRTERSYETLDDAVPAPMLDPELGVIQRRYGDLFRTALRDTLDALDAESRSLLRLHYLDGVNIDRIAVLLHVSRATIGRRLIAVRHRLADDLHRRLRERIDVSPDELTSLLRVLRSKLDLSLGSALRESSADGAR